MSLKHIDFDSVLRRLAERRIEEAMEQGKFANLPGAGSPIELEPMPADENARLTWWALRILRQNDFTPEEVRWRKALDYLRDKLDTLGDESQLERLVAQINQLVRQINTLGTNALHAAVTPLCLDEQREKLRQRLARS